MRIRQMYLQRAKELVSKHGLKPEMDTYLAGEFQEIERRTLVRLYAAIAKLEQREGVREEAKFKITASALKTRIDELQS